LASGVRVLAMMEKDEEEGQGDRQGDRQGVGRRKK